MRDDIEAILAIVQRAVYVHIAAFISGSLSDGDLGRLSTDSDKALRQIRWRWSEACRRWYARGVTHEPADVNRSVILPYGRRLHIETWAPSLVRVAQVLDRVRVPLLEALAADELDGLGLSDDGLDLGRRLIAALVSYDLPAVAALASDHPDIRQGLSEILHVSRAEFDAMPALDDERWAALGRGRKHYGRFDPSWRS